MFLSTLLMCLIGLLGWHSGRVSCSYSTGGETKIRKSLIYIDSYDPVSRPSSQTHIKAGLNIFAIDELNLQDQKLTLAGWMTFEWHDDRIMWNTTENDDIKYIFAKPENIWKPELIIDNALKDLDIIESQALLLRLKYDGTIDWEPPKLFITHCEVDITYYPYDTQKCAVELLSWSYTIDEVILDHLFEEVNLEDFQEHGEWQILYTRIEDRNLTEHLPDGTLRVYPQLNFWIALQRRAGFYNLNVIMPIVMTSFLVDLVFLVPISSGEKITYILTEFLALLVLLTIVIPPTSITVSVLALWLGFVLIVAASGIMSTVIVLYLYHKEGSPAKGSWISRVSVCFAKVLCWKMTSIGLVDKIDKSGVRQISVESIKVSDIRPPSYQDFKKKGLTTATKPDAKTASPELAKAIKDEDDNEEEERDITWKMVGMVFDKFCFYLYLIFTIVMDFTFVLALSAGGQTSAK
ncbi:acetylcholine receptor subunit beta-like 2 isoform X2 [Ruditapes philippinarum]|uniref:acetylcholine receptor subunit beta-like 2 isoform X2 n=1 Tax=Ruditapes philippinarum TaxID=129788 RepID=UPI00295B5E16|nr:acetylcholine receptor subunit beta-like 2 isoform X2 [Ruditapes philippinarum]